MNSRGFAHLVVLVVLVVVVAVGVVLWRSRLGVDTSKQVLSKPKICAQVLTAARNSTTQQCTTFPTPCDVPAGWVAVESCEPSSPAPTPSVTDTSNWKVYSGVGGFSFKYPVDWRFDVKNTSSKVFDKLYFMHILEFDKVDSTRKDPYGLLLGRIELTYFSSPDLEGKSADDYVADNFQYGQPSSKDVTIGTLSVKLVRHTNCPWSKDCVNVVYKLGTTIFDWRLLVQESKEEDLQLVYAILGTFEFK